jgi:hypothetical protein
MMSNEGTWPVVCTGSIITVRLPKNFVPIVPRTPSAVVESTLKFLLVMLPPLSASEEIMTSDTE